MSKLLARCITDLRSARAVLRIIPDKYICIPDEIYSKIVMEWCAESDECVSKISFTGINVLQRRDEVTGRPPEKTGEKILYPFRKRKTF